MASSPLPGISKYRSEDEKMRYRFSSRACIAFLGFMATTGASASISTTPYPLDWVRQIGTASSETNYGLATDLAGNV